MSLRRRLLVLFALTVVVSVAAVTWIVSAMARRAFDRVLRQTVKVDPALARLYTDR